jgi:Universal stress protein family
MSTTSEEDEGMIILLAIDERSQSAYAFDEALRLVLRGDQLFMITVAKSKEKERDEFADAVASSGWPALVEAKGAKWRAKTVYADDPGKAICNVVKATGALTLVLAHSIAGHSIFERIFSPLKTSVVSYCIEHALCNVYVAKNFLEIASERVTTPSRHVQSILAFDELQKVD